MTLSTGSKDYIAEHFGRNNCFASSGISFTDPMGTRQTGSTMDVVSTLEEDKYGSGPARGPNGEQWERITDYRSITSQDVMSIGSMSWCVGDGGGGSGGGSGGTQCTEGATRCNGNYEEMCINGIWERNYCPYGCTNGECNSAPSTSGCTPGTKRCNRGNIETCNSSGAWKVSTYCDDGCEIRNGEPACSATSSGGGGGSGGSGGDDPSSSTGTGPFTITIKEGEDCTGQGTPSVSLDTSGAHPYFKASPKTYVGVSGIWVKNNSGNCYIYMAWEMRLWDNPAGTTPTSCPTGDPELTEISRFLAKESDTKSLSITTLGGYENLETFGTFEIPASMKGKKILCLTLWGNFNKQALLDELAGQGYEKSPLW